MAVRALSRSPTRATKQSASLSPGLLAVPLAAPALDLFSLVQPAVTLSSEALVANAAAVLVLALVWARFPRTSWLVAAALASLAGLSMRLVGADVAPLLCLLSVVALGVGGAFSSDDVQDINLEAA
jgi:hypothetical protein